MRYLVAVIVCMISVSVFGQTDVYGCATSIACNYNPDATIDDGSCSWCEEVCVNPAEAVAYTLTVESAPAQYVQDHTVYRFYVNMTDYTDKMSSVFGNDQQPLVINTPSGIFNSSCGSWGWSAPNCQFMNCGDLNLIPCWDKVDDSYATIGLDEPAAGDQAYPSLVEDNYLDPTISEYFTSGNWTQLNVNTLTGGSWYVLNTAANSLPDADMRVLVMQITTSGSISGTLNYQVFPLGVGIDQVQISVDFDGAGTFGDGSIENACGCMDSTACNYNPSAEYDDESCTYAGNFYDCNGECLNDLNGDGICDSLCPEDLDSDGYITIQDLLLILSDFGCDTACENDITQDGYVAVDDLLLVLSEFGNSCE